MIKQFLKLKTKQSTYGVIYRNRCLSQDYVKLKKPLYNDFYLRCCSIHGTYSTCFQSGHKNSCVKKYDHFIRKALRNKIRKNESERTNYKTLEMVFDICFYSLSRRINLHYC